MAASSQFNVGKDVTLDIVGPTGPIRFAGVVSFNSKANYKSLDSKGLDGIDRYEDLPAGWSGTIKLDRADSSVDDFFANKESAFYAGLSQSSAITITETITEISGAVTQYRYVGVALTYQDAGDKSADNKITLSIGYRAARRLKIS